MYLHLLYNFIDKSRKSPYIIPRIVKSFTHHDNTDHIVQLIKPMLTRSIKELMISNDFGLLYPKILVSENGFSGLHKWDIVEYCLLSGKTGPLQVFYECFPEYFRRPIIEKIMQQSIIFENVPVFQFMVANFEVTEWTAHQVYMSKEPEMIEIMNTAGYLQENDTDTLQYDCYIEAEKLAERHFFNFYAPYIRLDLAI